MRIQIFPSNKIDFQIVVKPLRIFCGGFLFILLEKFYSLNRSDNFTVFAFISNTVSMAVQSGFFGHGLCLGKLKEQCRKH